MSGLAQQKVGIREYGRGRKPSGASGKGSGGGGATAPRSSSQARTHTDSATDRSKRDRNVEDDNTRRQAHKRHKLATAGGEVAHSNALLEVAKDMSAEDALLAVADMMRYVAGKLPQNVADLTRERDEALQALDEASRRAEEAEAKYDEVHDLVKTSKATGALSPRYPKLLVQRLVKRKDFENFFLEVTAKAQQVGQSKGLKHFLTQFPELGNHGLPTMEELDEAIAADEAEMKAAFENAICDENVKFAFLEHLKKQKFLPNMEGLRGLDVDFNHDLPKEMHPPKKGSRGPSHPPVVPNTTATPAAQPSPNEEAMPEQNAEEVNTPRN